MSLGGTPSKIRRKTYDVGKYSIGRQVLGQGAFGIVYKGTDDKYNPVAAKRIDASQHSRIKSQEYDRLLQLAHNNIIKILDVEKEEDKNLYWIFMPFCELGDLNKYYRISDVHLIDGVIIMTQIVSGISYLHENNIIHRDVKPGNILVASGEPPCVKLTDFDVTKFLDPEIETSVMSSNVGTNAFKAPEFFLRDDRKKVQYHRNVDVYAAGLTFLAIIQYDKSLSMLIPQIETPQHPSERHAPIGQLVAERIRYKIRDRNILKDDSLSTKANESGAKHTLKTAIRNIIRSMTCEKPEDRLSAAETLNALTRMTGDSAKRPLSFGDSLMKVYSLQLEEPEAFMEETWSLAVNYENQTFVSGLSENREIIRVMDSHKRVEKDIISLCPAEEKHSYCRSIVEHPTDYSCILEASFLSNNIRMYKVDSGEGKVVFQDCEPVAMCQGPDQSVLVWDQNMGVLQLKWSHQKECLKLIRCHNKVKQPKTPKSSMCFTGDVLILLCPGEFCQAMRLGTSSILWIEKDNDNVVKGRTVTCDIDGRAYIGGHNFLSVVNPTDGRVLQRVDVRHSIADMRFTVPDEEKLILLSYENELIYFDIFKQ